MEELYVEGVATRDDPEPCVGVREGTGEASGWARAGRAIELRAKSQNGRRCSLSRFAEVPASSVTDIAARHEAASPIRDRVRYTAIRGPVFNAAGYPGRRRYQSTDREDHLSIPQSGHRYLGGGRTTSMDSHICPLGTPFCTEHQPADETVGIAECARIIGIVVLDHGRPPRPPIRTRRRHARGGRHQRPTARR